MEFTTEGLISHLENILSQETDTVTSSASTGDHVKPDLRLAAKARLWG